MRFFFVLAFLISFTSTSEGQHSVAREWNEELLHAIRGDFARPTVHARNLFHVSAAMYDAWAVFDEESDPFFLGNTIEGFEIPFDGFEPMGEAHIEQEKAICYSAFRILRYRFRFAPDGFNTLRSLDARMDSLGYDKNFVSTDYSTGDGAALGNYIAEKVIEFGLQDGSNEIDDFNNLYYEPVNDPLVMAFSGNADIADPNRWQPLTLDVFIDQAGNIIPFDTPDFLSPEWGRVIPFALTEENLTINERDSNEYWVYHAPIDPPLLDTMTATEIQEYQWGFLLVAQWSSHLDPDDGVMWDISPGSLGNVPVDLLPTTHEGLRDFYNATDGGDLGTGHIMNPITEQPYEPNMVPRGDYTRVLAEFWADGPDSETPPGHWFTILNYVSDQPELEKSYRGDGEILDSLEWDIKSYFVLGGAMHDAAVSTWGIKGWYDYPRPVSAIRYMAEKGQSTYPDSPNYHVAGLPIVEGFSELVKEGDPLAGRDNQNLNEIKIYAWRGPDFISNPSSDEAGVGWILAKDWWPYQRPSFVSPPFAGYLSGHSTFSRAAAEILTKITGSDFFPGGIGEFTAAQDEFLVFEDGPSQDITLQWATYRDASDQTSLSRIWGGIHPPADDIPGRLIGIKVANAAIAKAEEYFNYINTSTENIIAQEELSIYPNPIKSGETLNINNEKLDGKFRLELFNLNGAKLMDRIIHLHKGQNNVSLDAVQLIRSGQYTLTISNDHMALSQKLIIIE